MLTTNDKEDIHISYLSAVCASASISFLLSIENYISIFYYEIKVELDKWYG